ncbi:odorant receptor 131-2-like [Nematolebias whitei]|uniref:odorant receptor 131-2-like n=1 Tax=Nematolebias whitei TaxID=451745 RepID=UPI00189B526E|nr:odorant receptor 131-2-like [Nematolebias whitei]
MNSSSSNFNVSSNLNTGNQDGPGLAAAKYVIVLALGFILNYISGALIHTFRKHQVFFLNPRYVLLIHLVVNDMVQLTTSISLFISYVSYKINASVCCLMMTVAVFTTMNTPLNLAAMALERYVAVCFPLQHVELCTVKRTYVLIGCIWALSSVAVLFQTIVLLSTEPLSFFHSAIVCLMEKLFQHPISLQMRGITYIIYLTVVWFTLFFTYFKIFFAARAANSADGNATKARNTILLHGVQLLLCMLTYLDPLVKTHLIGSFPNISSHLRYVWYIIVDVLPRFISPIVYGLRDKTFKLYLRKSFKTLT